MGRIAAVDAGERRIGLAISDPTGTLARPLETIRIPSLDRGAAKAVADRLTSLMQEDDGLDAVVVGLPLRLDGSANAMTPRVQAFAAELRRRLACIVVLQDERLTSHEAESRLALREKDWRVRKAKLDAAAAAVILQEYLDARTPAGATHVETDA